MSGPLRRRWLNPSTVSRPTVSRWKMSLSQMEIGARKQERQRTGALQDAGANGYGAIIREASWSAGSLNPFFRWCPSAKKPLRHSFFPVSFSYASRYFALVLAIASSGSFGPGGLEAGGGRSSLCHPGRFCHISFRRLSKPVWTQIQIRTKAS